jgi:CheY-like chemotaxis protein
VKENQISQSAEFDGARLPAQTSPAHRILVVEDDHDIRRLNTEVLAGSGYHVDAVEDGAVAWEILQRQNYDLMVTDNEMPNMTGVELLKKLHAVRKALPVIMATGKMPKDEFRSAPWLHPTAMLRKPYTADDLVETVREVLRTNLNVRDQGAPLPDDSSHTPGDHWKV